MLIYLNAGPPQAVLDWSPSGRAGLRRGLHRTLHASACVRVSVEYPAASQSSKKETSFLNHCWLSGLGFRVQGIVPWYVHGGKRAR